MLANRITFRTEIIFRTKISVKKFVKCETRVFTIIIFAKTRKIPCMNRSEYVVSVFIPVCCEQCAHFFSFSNIGLVRPHVVGLQIC